VVITFDGKKYGKRLRMKIKTIPLKGDVTVGALLTKEF
jgi:hypothetical protein